MITVSQGMHILCSFDFKSISSKVLINYSFTLYKTRTLHLQKQGSYDSVNNSYKVK